MRQLTVGLWLVLCASSALADEEEPTGIRARGTPRNTAARLSVPAPRSVDASCAAPLWRDGAACVLDGDVWLGSRPIEIRSAGTLDCKGHAIRGDGFLGVIMRGTQGATLRDCTIEGFQTGVLVIASRLPAIISSTPARETLRNRIVGNRISGVRFGIVLEDANDVRVEGNTVSFSHGGGSAILVENDSDRNEIVQNVVKAPTPPERRVLFPDLSWPDELRANGGIELTWPFFRPVLHLEIGGELIEVVRDVGPAPGYVPRAPEDNLVEGNEVRMTFNAPGRESVGVLFGWAARGNLVRENVIHTADTGLTSMIQFSPETFPGECARSPLHCVADEDCGDRGPCEGVRTFPAGVVDSRNQSTIVDNTFLGPFRAHNASGSSKGDRWIDNTFKNVGGLGIEVFGDIPGAGIDGQTFVGATDTLVSGNMIDGARLAISDWGLRSVIVENEVMNSINTGILLRPPGSSAVVARNTVDKVALGSAVNIQAPGSTVGDNVVRRAAAFGIFVFGGGFSGTVVHDNRIENNGVAIGLNLNAPVPFAMKISRNDIVQANASFRVVTLFPPASPPAQPEVFELSDELRGNYWGRTCDDDKGFREAALPPPQDSNHIRLVDSHPYGQPVAGQPLDAFAPCL